MGSLGQLERLHALHAAGALTDEEYAREKDKVLGSGATSILTMADATPPPATERVKILIAGALAVLVALVVGIVLFTGQTKPTGVGGKGIAAPDPTIINSMDDAGGNIIVKDIDPASSSASGPPNNEAHSAENPLSWRSANFSVQADVANNLCRLTITSDDERNQIILTDKKNENVLFSASLKGSYANSAMVQLSFDVSAGPLMGYSPNKADDSLQTYGHYNDGWVSGTPSHEFEEAISDGTWDRGTMSYAEDQQSNSATYELSGSKKAYERLLKCSANLPS